MKVNMRNYTNDNLLIVDIFSDKEKLKNILIISYSDDKRDIILKKVVFNDISPLETSLTLKNYGLLTSYSKKYLNEVGKCTNTIKT